MRARTQNSAGEAVSGDLESSSAATPSPTSFFTDCKVNGRRMSRITNVSVLLGLPCS